MKDFYNTNLGVPFEERLLGSATIGKSMPAGLLDKVREGSKAGLSVIEWEGSPVFINNGHEPEEYLSCPYCGGSGHKDDVVAPAPVADHPVLAAGTMLITIGEVQQEFFVAGIQGSTKAIAITGATSDEENHDESLRDALRIAACWNACRGMPTELLEKANFLESANAALDCATDLTKERDQFKALAKANAEALSNALAESKRLKWLVRVVYESLPREKTWLDPDLEREMKAISNPTTHHSDS